METYKHNAELWKWAEQFVPGPDIYTEPFCFCGNKKPQGSMWCEKCQKKSVI